jgi:CRP/FNR family transcriptional regulator, cyclic AMP receptor protein
MSFQVSIEELPLSTYLTGPERDLLTPFSRLIEGKAGDRLIREGEPVRTMYILLGGEADIIKGSADGNQRVIASVGKGALLGERAPVDDSPATATVEAKGEFTALAMDRHQFDRLMDANPRLACKILREIAKAMSQHLKITSALLAEYMDNSFLSDVNVALPDD